MKYYIERTIGLVVMLAATGMLACVGVAILAASGCSSKPYEEKYPSIVKEEASAESIDAHTDFPDEPVVPDIEPVVEPERCHCCDGCICAKGACLCATGEKCCPGCKCHRSAAWFWCQKCQSWSHYMAKDGQRITECKHCRHWGCYRVLDKDAAEWERKRKLNRQAAVSYRAASC